MVKDRDSENGSSGRKPEPQSKSKEDIIQRRTTPFRIIVGSYEHNLLCLSAHLGDSNPLFEPIFHLEAHSLSIKCVDFAKRYLVTGSNDEHLRIYDLQKRKELGSLFGHQGTISVVKFSKEALKSGDSSSPAHSGKWLLSGSEDGNIIIWRTKDWELFGTLKGHKGAINDIDIHPSGRVAISVGRDKTVILWNLMTAKKAAILKLKGRDTLGQSGESVVWSHSGDYFIVGLMNQILIYKTSIAKIIKKVKFQSTLMCMKIVMINNIEYLVTGHSNGSLQFFDFNSDLLNGTENAKEAELLESKPESVEPRITKTGHTNRVKGLSYIEVENEGGLIPYLVSISSDGSIVVWDISTEVFDQVAVYNTGERLNCVALCPEGVEKYETMKKRVIDTDGLNEQSESEYETDGEAMRKVLTPKNKRRRKNKKPKVSVTREESDNSKNAK